MFLKKKSIFISSGLLIIILALFISGCSSPSKISGITTTDSYNPGPLWNNYSVEIIDLKFYYPRDWSFHPNINATNQLTSVVPRKNGTIIPPIMIASINPVPGKIDPVVFVIAEKIPPGMTTEQYLSERKSNLKKFRNTQSVELPTITTGKKQLYGLSYEYMREGNTTPHYARDYVSIKDDMAIRIIYEAGIDINRTYDPAFDTILSTFS